MRPRDSRGSGAEWRGFARAPHYSERHPCAGSESSATGACDAAGRREKARETWGAGRVWRSETLLTPRGPRLALSGSQSLAPPRGRSAGCRSRRAQRISKNTCSLIRDTALRMIYNRNGNILVGRDHTFAARGPVSWTEMAARARCVLCRACALVALLALGNSTRKLGRCRARVPRVRP